MNKHSLLVTSVIALTLTACSSKPAADLYVLRVPDSAAKTCTVSRSISIDRPSAPTEYDGKRVALMLNHNHLSYYTGAAWASPFPDQLQGFMSDAFTRQGLNVLDTDADSASKIHLTIREADITDINAPIIHLRLTGSISNVSGHATHFSVNEAVPATENHMPQIIDAYDQAALNAVNTISNAMKLHCSGT